MEPQLPHINREPGSGKNIQNRMIPEPEPGIPDRTGHIGKSAKTVP
jgi:hypothetical protein